MNNNDYTVSILAEQRRQDLIAEAQQDRLARLATADRTPWWQRLARTPRALAPRPFLRHRVAH